MMNVGNTGRGRRVALLLTTIAGALVLCSGVALAATVTCHAGTDCLGTKRADTLKGTGSYDNIYGRRGGDTIRGFDRWDNIYGQGGPDRLFGGPGPDLLYGSVGDDALNGGAGSDTYYFSDGWSRDSITDGAGSGDGIQFVGSLEGAVTDDLIVDLRSGPGPEAKDVGGTYHVSWQGSVVEHVQGGEGDDRITGNAAANVISGYAGKDTIYGGKGDDDIGVIDASFGDTVFCGAGEDTVSYDADTVGVVSDSVDLDTCEHLNAF